jgi:hypothetical protein
MHGRFDFNSRAIPLLFTAGAVLMLFSGCQPLRLQTRTDLGNAQINGAAVSPVPAQPGRLRRESTISGESPKLRTTREQNTQPSAFDPSPILPVSAEESDPPDELESWFPRRNFKQPGRSSRPADDESPFAQGLGSPINGDSPLFAPPGSDSREKDSVVSLLPADDASVGAEEPTFFDGDDRPLDAADPHAISFKEDVKQLPWMLWNDNLALYTWNNAVILGVAAGGAVAVRDNLDQRVRAETAEHPLRWGEGSVVLRQFGEYTVQVPALAAVYAVSLWTDDECCLHEFSKSAISAYALSAMYTVAIKGITNTSRPTTEFQHGRYGFPSYHASSTFSLAAVVDEYYGWQWGVPAYVMAGLVGWSRIDQREHDLSDVLFGAVLGVVVGKTVAAVHLERYSNLRVTPYFDPVTRASGVTVDTKF